LLETSILMVAPLPMAVNDKSVILTGTSTTSYLITDQKYGIFFPPWTNSPSCTRALLIIEASRSYSDTPQAVGLLWTSDYPDSETSTWQCTTLKRDSHPCPRRDSNLPSHQASGHRPTP